MPANEVDVNLRQAVFYEYVKEKEADDEESRIEEIMAVLLAVILASKIDFTRTVPKSKLTALLAKIKAKLGTAFEAHDKALNAAMTTVLSAVVDVTKSNMGYVTGKKITAEAFKGTQGANKALWLKLTKEVVPGVGIEAKSLILDLGKSAITDASRLVKQAYVEKWSTDQIVKAIRGTPSLGFKDGLTRKLANKAKTTVRTLGSHINSFTSYALGKLFYETYQWLSTIDAVTTNICRSRHMKVYRYGEGPRPPAHYNCRSIIVGMAGSLANQYGNSYFSWLQSQPDAVLRELLTERERRDFSEGTAKASDYQAFRNNKRLTPEAFGKKLPTMQAS